MQCVPMGTFLVRANVFRTAFSTSQPQGRVNSPLRQTVQRKRNIAAVNRKVDLLHCCIYLEREAEVIMYGLQPEPCGHKEQM